MQEIYLGKYNGFCQGVSKAVKTAEKVCEKGVCVLGELIHNERITKSLERKGAKIVHDVSEIDGKKVVIRSHGVGKNVYEQLKKLDCEIIDLTCPFVRRTQNIVEEYYKKGYKIVIVGKKHHPEVVGLNGWCDETAVICDCENENLSELVGEKVCIVAQTTVLKEKFVDFLQKINKNAFKTLEIFDTICYTTRERQNEAKNLSEKCDCMIVVGSKTSSNTKELYEICTKNCKNVFWVENAESLKNKKTELFKKVGIVSGASTSTEQTMEVFFSMEKNTEAQVMAGEAEVMANEDVVVEATEQAQVVETAPEHVMNEMEEAVAKMDEKQTKFRKGQKITATISSATDEGLAVYISNTKKEILLPKEEINCEVYNKAEYAKKVGEEIQVKIIGLNPVQLSEKAIAKDIEAEKLVKEIEGGDVEFSVTVTGFNKGGVIGEYAGFEVFVPSSQIRIGFAKDLEKYVGKTLRLKAEKIENGRRKQIVASQRVILEAEKAARDAEKAAKEEEFFGAVSVGDTIRGTAVRFASFGAFIDVNGIDCLAHISDLSWTGCNAPGEVLELNKEYEFKVLKCDKETKKVSLGYKQLQPRPWELVPGKYMVGDVVTGKVVRIVPFGAFVELEKGIDGLVHVSQISHEWLENPTSALKVGEEVEAKIIAIDHEKEKITLSIKAMTPAPETPAKPRKEREEGVEGTDKPRRARKPRTDNDDGEVREWKEDNNTGISIAELLANSNK